MKRLVVVLSGLLVLPAFAEVAPIYYTDAIEMSDADMIDQSDITNDTEFVSDDASNVVVQTAPVVTNPRNSGRTTSSRAVPGTGARYGTRTNITNSDNSSTRNLSTRASNTNTTTVARTTASRASTTRAGITGASRTAGAPGGMASAQSHGVVASRTIPAGVNSARSAAPTTQARASIVQTDTVNKPLYTGRVGATTSVRARIPTIRMASSSTTIGVESDAETKAQTAASMDELAQMTDYCKAQYTQCMDNFCNVLDDNQGRCSCSANLKNYSKTETALKDATESLQDVAQQIQYIGLSKDDVETLFAQTEAELSMSNSSDNSQLKNDLDRIKNMIVDVKTGTASVTDTTGMSFDLSGLLDFSISSTGFDLGALFGTTTTNTSSISNQRGEQLYRTATARCKAAVLNTCAAQGVDVSVITNAYDLEIDKQCIAYERSLSDANNQMSATVRNAKSVLQKARLMVAQQKNAYDLRGCVNALDTCMQDEFVCGSDYENCLDPTGKYIVNGEIVIGSKPGMSGGDLTATSTSGEGLYSVWNYTNGGSESNAFGNGDVASYVDAGLYSKTAEMTGVPTTATLAKYLQQKIGYVDTDGKSLGMCVSVLNKCQNYTYTGTTANGKSYNPKNNVIRNYLERVSMQIKAAQDTVLAEHAENCISDVVSCLNQNNHTSLSTQNLAENQALKIAVAACKPMINTCMSVSGWNADIDSNITNWLKAVLGITEVVDVTTE